MAAKRTERSHRVKQIGSYSLDLVSKPIGSGCRVGKLYTRAIVQNARDMFSFKLSTDNDIEISLVCDSRQKNYGFWKFAIFKISYHSYYLL